jgi:hypothetical protein
MDRLVELKDHPDQINQGVHGLCGEATFYHHVIQRSPEKFLAMGQALFRDGRCQLGKLKISPRETLLKADYPTHATAFVPTAPNFTRWPPQADWMLLTALRDSKNLWSHKYEGMPGGKAEGSTTEERYRWYRQCGLYIEDKVDLLVTPEFVEPSEETGLIEELLGAIKKTSTHHISMDLNEAMIRSGFDGEHTLSLESPLEVDVSGDRVKFEYWSWAKKGTGKNGNLVWNDLRPGTGVLTVHEFLEYLRGVIIAPYSL